MIGECDRCDERGELANATILAQSDEIDVQLCETCRDLIDTPRCSACGRRREGTEDTDALNFDDDPLTQSELCDRCRTEIGRPPRRLVEA